MMPIVENKQLDLFVKEIKKVKNTYTVTFQSKEGLEQTYKFTIEQMVEYRITLNKWFTFTDLDIIIKSSNISKWYRKTLDYIFIKPRTTKEIINYLEKSDLDLNSKNQIISKLTEYKYLDDDAYVKSFILDSMNKCLGKTYVIHTLERLGISLNLINKYIETYQEQDLIEELTIKYQKIQYTLVSLPITKQKLKLTQKMALKGISTTTIQELLKRLEFTEEIDTTFIKDLNRIKKLTNDNNLIIQKLLRLGYTYDYIKRHIDV